MLVVGEYTSVWDGGIEVVSQVEVDLEQMRITSFGERWLAGAAEGGEDPDELEYLEEEYLYIPEMNTTYTVAPAYAASWVDDAYGNGIVVYGA